MSITCVIADDHPPVLQFLSRFLSNNEITITRYHVSYRRADGRNTQGVDVPYAFDGAATATVPATGNVSIGFELVRQVGRHPSAIHRMHERRVSKHGAAHPAHRPVLVLVIDATAPVAADVRVMPERAGVDAVSHAQVEIAIRHLRLCRVR